MKLRTLGFLLTAAAVTTLLGSLVLGLRRPADERAREPVPVAGSVPIRERIRVEVLNAAGISGLARQVTETLRSDGFDVVYYGNAGRLARDSTTILDRSGNQDAVDALAATLRIERIEQAIDTTLYLEATVVLGPDWPEIARR